MPNKYPLTLNCEYCRVRFTILNSQRARNRVKTELLKYNRVHDRPWGYCSTRCRDRCEQYTPKEDHRRSKFSPDKKLRGL